MRKLSVLLLFPLFIFSQDHDNHDVNHGHDNEFSIAFGFIPNENFSLGFHAHYIRGLAFENKLGLGVSLETILDEHAHHSISLITIYRFSHSLTIAYAPGILRVSEESKVSYEFTQHFELAYEIPIGEFHIGPQVDLGIEDEGIHYMLGVHFGIDF